jgi:ribonuclease VapC
LIVDTSAIMAIILNEPERASFIASFVTADQVRMSAGSWIELAAVLTRRQDPILEAAAADLVARLKFGIEPVSLAQAEFGRAAYKKYGRGTGHPANLNFGDCFAYALSRETGEPLLFKGEDFGQTDIEPAA